MGAGVSGKVVVITGASGGLGAATARHLVPLGAKVVLGARRLDRLRAIAREIGISEEAVVETDVTRPDQCVRLVERAVELHGRIDVLLNNAGIMPLSAIERAKVADWDRMIDVNIKGTLYGIAAALPLMIAQKSGHIINVSSVAGHKVRSTSAVYSATKTAVRVISEGLRQEVKPYGIRTTILSPGMMATDLIESVTEQDIAAGMRKAFESAIPATAFAAMVTFAIQQPDYVDVNEILFRPTHQEY